MIATCPDEGDVRLKETRSMEWLLREVRKPQSVVSGYGVMVPQRSSYHEGKMFNRVRRLVGGSFSPAKDKLDPQNWPTLRCTCQCVRPAQACGLADWSRWWTEKLMQQESCSESLDDYEMTRPI